MPVRPAPAPSSFARLLGRRLWVGGLALLVAGAALATLALSGASADASSTSAVSTTSTSTSTGTGEQGRARLRADLKQARALDGTARADAVKAIRAKARAGTYGPAVERALTRRAHRRAAVVALLPDQMQADLKAARQADPADRKALRQAIAKKAADGGYGAKVAAASKKFRGFYRR